MEEGYRLNGELVTDKLLRMEQDVEIDIFLMV